MRSKVLVLGAGFGGLELATVLSAELGEDAGVTLIDSNDAFVFGYSKLDVMFGRTAPDAVRLHYADFAKPGIRFLAERVTAIEPEARRVTTDQGVHEGDSLVIALGADYDFGATPGLRGGIDEFYSVRGAEYLRERGCELLGGSRRGRRLRCAVQVPARAERGGAPASRPPRRARRPRLLRDPAGHAVLEADPAVARRFGGAARSVRRARGSSSSRGSASRRSTTTATSLCVTTARRSPSTCSSACRSTALRTSSRTAA